MTETLVRGTLFGGIILFLWGAFSWMVLPWHMQTFHAVRNERAVSSLLQENTARDGAYLVPFPVNEPGQGPAIFMAIRKEGAPQMRDALLNSFFTQMLAAFLMTWLTLKTYGLSYWRRVSFVTLVALTGAILCHLPYWNWWGFPSLYTVVALADVTVGWFLGGLWIAKITGREN